MKKQELDPRYTVVRWLQEKLSSLDPCSYEYELHDKAYSLALNPKRKVDAFFKTNVLRDAGRILRRQYKPIFVSLNQDPPFDIESLIFDKSVKLYGNEAESNLEDTTIRNTVMFLCEQTHPKAKGVFICMLDGYDINQTADRNKLSISMVKKLRCKISKEIKLKFAN